MSFNLTIQNLELLNQTKVNRIEISYGSYFSIFPVNISSDGKRIEINKSVAYPIDGEEEVEVKVHLDNKIYCLITIPVKQSENNSETKYILTSNDKQNIGKM